MIASPIRARYGLSFVDLYSDPVTVVMYAVTCYIEPRYNGNDMYSYSSLILCDIPSWVEMSYFYFL